MTWRFLTFLGSLLIGVVLGGSLESPFQMDDGALCGVIAGALLWFFFDASQAKQLLQWLRADKVAKAGIPAGLWGDIASRCQHLLDIKDRAITDGEHRLQDFLSALQASPNGVVLLDSQTRIEWCNQTAASHFGLDLKRDLQQIFGNLVRDPDFARYLSARNFGSELLMPGRHSTTGRPVNLSVQIHPYGGGRLLLLSRDVTALEQALVMRRDFVANVSHEIRTPLTVLAGFVETLQTLDLTDEEREHYLNLMAQQASRMQALVSDLLMLSRLEGSPAPGVEVWTPVSVLMQMLEQDAKALMQVMTAATDVGQHQLTFDCRFDGQISGVLQELHSAMGNMVSNAIRHTPPGGCILVRFAAGQNGHAEFVVYDNGPGIASEHLPRLTERFYRVDRSRSRETGGTGLGLAIVKHVAQRHGAELAIDSTVGKGTTCKIIFPDYRLKV